MAWWRRDPSLYPIHRCAQRLLRSHEAALRTRCFSRTPPNSAKHEDDDGSKRPTGMSSLEWMQLQHYKQWRKRLMDDPYQAMFGASNDMLNGKGLKDWEWISKTFPRWMVREMGMDDAVENDKATRNDGYAREHGKKPGKEEGSSAQTLDNNSTSANSSSPTPKKQESHFPQPSFRATRIDRDDSIGIISPSDLRRPREQPHVKVIRNASEVQSAPTLDTRNNSLLQNAPTSFASSSPSPPMSVESASKQLPEEQSPIPTIIETPSKEPSARESSFIEQFLADKPQQEHSNTEKHIHGNTWRQTALQRRSSGGLTTRPKTVPSQIANSSDEAVNTVTSHVTAAIEMPPPQGIEEASEAKAGEPTTQGKDWLVQQEPSTNMTAIGMEDSTATSRSRSRILDQIPKDDIDFLSAADIRASMGVRKSKIPSDEERRAERQKLENTFKDTHKVSQEIDPMIKSKIINDQLVRRLERELRPAQECHESTKPQAEQHPTNQSIVQGTAIESSIDRMKRWLEQGGAIFSSHFWQDPTEEADATKTKLFFDKVMARIRKGRATMKQVVEDLEIDLPATKPLLKRLKDDEEMLDAAIQALRLHSGTGKPQGLTPRKFKAIQALRLKFLDTDRELDAAYTSLRGLEKTDVTKGASPAMKRRLSIASQICHKNAHLTRYLIWSLQARLEDPEVDHSRLVHYKAVANSLLTLRDTQMALARLVDYAMQVYGVAPNALDNIEFMDRKYGMGDQAAVVENGQLEESSIISQGDKARIRANVAADERLANEVEAQKSAMQGLSDDGYARTPKLAPRRTYNERSPLAHSLFRPFGPVLESLGKETSETVEAKKANEDAKKDLDDAKLVAEVRKAYEDTYGPITLKHTQLVDPVEKARDVQEKDVKTFEMLKENPASSAPTVDLTSPATEARCIEIPAPSAVSTDQHSTVAPIVDETGSEKIQTRGEVTVADDPSEADHRSAAITENTSSSAVAATAAEPNDESLQRVSETSLDTMLSPSSAANLPTHYTILIHDLQTDHLSITTSTTGPPRDTSPALPLHEALSILDMPAKFIPYITEGLEVVNAKKDMLVLRDALDDVSSTRSFETVRAPSSTPSVDELETERRTVNPIDGTTRLSPTGYVGPEESQEQLEKEFQERREAAGKFSRNNNHQQERSEDQKETKGRRRGGAGSVAKTAIWAAAVCYIVGVLGEIATSPFTA
ncbi:Nn.00g023310.m01.CDS01 [Neocucurbitaria sp. VM-36]